MANECLFNENSVGMIMGGSALLALILLGIFGRNRCRCSDYIFGTWNLIAFTMHMIFDGYFLYAPRLTKKMAGEQVPKGDDFYGCYVHAVGKVWRDYAEIDTRMYLDEAQPAILTSAYGCVYAGGSLCLLTFFGYLLGCKCTPLLQTATAVWHIARLYFCIFMPEYLDGFKHITDMRKFAVFCAPIVVMSVLALLTTFCKMCCCCSGAAVCPFAPAAATAQQAEKKKKQ